MSTPEVQYAVLCKEVIETKVSGEQELTFKGVFNEVWVPDLRDIVITLALRLLNVNPGSHRIDINCTIVPALEVLKYSAVSSVEPLLTKNKVYGTEVC